MPWPVPYLRRVESPDHDRRTGERPAKPPLGFVTDVISSGSLHHGGQGCGRDCMITPPRQMGQSQRPTAHNHDEHGGD